MLFLNRQYKKAHTRLSRLCIAQLDQIWEDMNMKRFLIAALAALMLASVLTACSGTATVDPYGGYSNVSTTDDGRVNGTNGSSGMDYGTYSGTSGNTTGRTYDGTNGRTYGGGSYGSTNGTYGNTNGTYGSTGRTYGSTNDTGSTYGSTGRSTTGTGMAGTR